MWALWLIASGVFFIAEIATTGFLIFWLGLGAIIAMIISFFTDSIIIQMTVFVISSVLFIFLTKPFVQKVTKKNPNVLTNAFSIIGKNALVVQEINPTLGTGQIKVNGEIWSAKTNFEGIIPKDSEVTIINIDGVKAVVADTVSFKVEETIQI